MIPMGLGGFPLILYLRQVPQLSHRVPVLMGISKACHSRVHSKYRSTKLHTNYCLTNENDKYKKKSYGEMP